MDIVEAEKLRIVLFYQQAQLTFANEIVSGYPHLRTISCYETYHFLRYVESFSIQEQLRLAHCFVKRSHEVAQKLLNLSFSEEEETLLRSYINVLSAWGSDYRSKHWQLQVGRCEEDAYEADTEYLETLALEKLRESEVLGKKTFLGNWNAPPDVDSTENFEVDPVCPYAKRVGDWQIETTIGTGKRSRLYHYYHRITRRDIATSGKDFDELGAPYETHAVTDFLAWLGLGHATWDIPCKEDAEEALASLEATCQFFFDQISPILELLSI